jgi:tetratricopeptide (TPR) repeat protein
MHTRALAGLFVTLLSMACHAGASDVPCGISLGEPTQQNGTWRYPLRLDAPGWFLAGVELRENGDDVVLSVRLGDAESLSDVAPTRYAIERSALLVYGPVRGHAEVRPFDVALRKKPTLVSLCFAPSAETFLEQLLWQGLVRLTQRSDADQSGYSRAQARSLAIAYGDAFVGLGERRGFHEELLASARHVQGYLASTAGRRAEAQAHFEDARRRWERVPEPALSLAATFNVAAEGLALGKAQESLETLQPLRARAVRDRYAPIWVWASNDYCVALRNLERRAEAADCFGQLVGEFDTMGEPKEAANAICNRGAALGAAGRWAEARIVLAECSARRNRLGFPSGIAHSELLLGWQALETDSTGSAAQHFQQSIAAARKSGETSRVWDARRWLAQAWIDGDELPRARLALAWLATDGAQESSRAAQWHMAMAQVELLGDDRAAALSHLGSAESQFAQLGQTGALTDARCLKSLIDLTIDVPSGCDALTAGQALLARGERAAARRQLEAPLVAADRDLLRRFLLAGSTDTARSLSEMTRIVAEAAALPLKHPRERSQRGQLLSRMAFELARLGESSGDGGFTRLAMDAAWSAGGTPAGLGRRLSNAGTAATPSPAFVAGPRPSPGEGTVLVASTSFLGNGYLLIARGERVSSVRLDMPALNATAATWRDRILDGAESFDAAEKTAAALRLDTWWRADDRRLMLALHGGLSTIPWSALPIPGPARKGLSYRPLVDQVSTQHVASDLRARDVQPPSSVIRFFPTETDGGLPGVGAERGMIADLARRSGWTTTTSDPSTGGILHIAGHAVADEVYADDNRLLAPNGSGEPLPFPRELVREARLVVLAGCETGYGPSSRWTLPSSLTSRAVADGAEAALGHLWPISDTAGMTLHTAFYRSLIQGNDAVSSLRTAQLALLDSPRQRLPRYWASPLLLMQRPPASGAAQSIAQSGSHLRETPHPNHQ